MPQGAEDIFARSGIETGRPPKFTREQARQFEVDTAVSRCKVLVERGVIGLAFSIAYLGIDWLLTPDVFLLSVFFRVGIVLPIGIAVLMIVRSNPAAFVREGLMALTTVLSGAAGLAIILVSESPLRVHHHHTFFLLALFAAVVLRLRLPYAIATCLACLGLEAASIVLVSQEGMARGMTDIATFMAASALSLIAAESFERNMRAAYLYGRHHLQRTENLENLSRHDPLTALGNRRALDDAVHELNQRDDELELAIIVADIDQFKSYNDAMGHPAGDICLKRVASLISAELRGSTDLAIRFGGEEFLVLLPDTSLATAIDIAERMRANVFDARIPHRGSSTGVVTVSFGVAAANGHVSTDELIAAADSALYAAKNAGRNQVWPLPVRPGAERWRAQAS